MCVRTGTRTCGIGSEVRSLGSTPCPGSALQLCDTRARAHTRGTDSHTCCTRAHAGGARPTCAPQASTRTHTLCVHPTRSTRTHTRFTHTHMRCTRTHTRSRRTHAPSTHTQAPHTPTHSEHASCSHRHASVCSQTCFRSHVVTQETNIRPRAKATREAGCDVVSRALVFLWLTSVRSEG